MTFQSQSINPRLTVYENLAYGLKIRKMPKELIDQKVNAVAEILALKDLLLRKAKVLTGIQRQRVALGRIIVREPKVILLDEPLAHLDAKLRKEVREEIIKLHARLDTIFLYATHDPIEAMTVGTRVAVMKNGVLQQIDTPQAIYNHPANFFVADFIGSPSMNFSSATLVEEEGEVFALLNGETRIPLSKMILEKLQNEKDYKNKGKSITLGIRPEDVHFAEENDGFLKLQAEVRHTENLGGETLLSCETGKTFFDMLSHGRNVHAGDEIAISVDTSRLQFFDGESGDSLLARD